MDTLHMTTYSHDERKSATTDGLLNFPFFFFYTVESGGGGGIP